MVSCPPPPIFAIVVVVLDPLSRLWIVAIFLAHARETQEWGLRVAISCEEQETENRVIQGLWTSVHIMQPLPKKQEPSTRFVSPGLRA